MSPAQGAPGRLLIHAEDAADLDGIRFGSWQRRLRALGWHGLPRDERAELSVQIDDLQGNPVLAIAAAGPLVEVPLPGGTYHVTARRGKLLRAYTMTIQQGASFDLHLRLKPWRS